MFIAANRMLTQRNVSFYLKKKTYKYMNRAEAIEILKNFKKNYSEKYGILLIGIFGSVARNEATAESDVDIVVKTEIPDPFNIIHLKNHLETELDISVDIVRLRDNMNPFLKEKIGDEPVYV